MEHEWQGCGQRWPGNVILWKRGVTCFQTQQCDGKSPASQMGRDGCAPEGPRLPEPPDVGRGRMWSVEVPGTGMGLQSCCATGDWHPTGAALHPGTRSGTRWHCPDSTGAACAVCLWAQGQLSQAAWHYFPLLVPHPVFPCCSQGAGRVSITSGQSSHGAETPAKRDLHPRE